jgi:hypothetical protein
VNTVLTTLYLRSNNIGLEGVRHLSDINERLRINKVNKKRLRSLQLLCANVIKKSGQQVKLVTLLC